MRVRDTSNMLMLRMSGEQICLQVLPELFGVNSWIAHMIRQLLVWQQKMHGSPKCYGELEELTVDDFWQIADAGDQELWSISEVRSYIERD